MWLSERRPIHRILLGLALLAVVGSGSVVLAALSPDTLTVREAFRDFGPQRRMSLSAYPVEVKQMGRALSIKSNNNQILPIYTESGVLYMVMRLSKGTNWLNGLPRGKYFINNHPISVK